MNQPDNRIVILTYHRIFNEETDGLTSDSAFYAISAKVFEQQLVLLKELGFKTIFPEEFLANRSLDYVKSVIITFDDGSMSDFEIALPLLRRQGFCAVFFICVELIGSPGYMGWREIRELAALGMSVQCHGLIHRNYSQFPESEAMAELLAARKCLERNLGTKVTQLAMPGGFANAKACRAGFAAGFHTILNSEQRMATRDKILRRFVLRKGTSFQAFAGIVNRNRRRLLSLTLLNTGTIVLKRALGRKFYDEIKGKLWK